MLCVNGKEDLMDVKCTLLHVLVNIYEALDITFMVFGSRYLILFLSSSPWPPVQQ
jgi:hypothetical protein